MPYFRYRAIDPQQRLQTGLLLATDAASAQQHLAEQQWVLLSLHRHWRSLFDWLSPTNTKHHTRQQQVFLDWCTQLKALLSAGIGLEEALVDLHQEGPPALRPASAEVLRGVRGGQSLSQALLSAASQPSIHFETRWLRLLAAGEHAGHLLSTLGQLLEHLGWDLQQRQHTRSQLLQPIISGLCVLGATLFLILHLAPQVRPMLDRQVPSISTQALFWLTDILQKWGTHLFWGGLLLGVILILAYRRHDGIRQHLQTVGLQIPGLGQLPLLHDLILYTRTLALLQRNGIPILQAMADSRATLSNSVIPHGLALAEAQVEAGQSLHAAFSEAASMIAPISWPSPFLRLIRQGERTGQLAQALQHIADQLQQRRRTLIQRQQALLQPTLTVFSGGLLAWVALALLGPFYEQLGRAW